MAAADLPLKDGGGGRSQRASQAETVLYGKGGTVPLDDAATALALQVDHDTRVRNSRRSGSRGNSGYDGGASLWSSRCEPDEWVRLLLLVSEVGERSAEALLRHSTAKRLRLVACVCSDASPATHA